MNLIVDSWRTAWKLWSVRLAAIAGVLSGLIVAAWPVASWLISQFIPEGPPRIALGAVVAAVVFVIPAITRLLPQKKLQEKTDGTAG